MDIADEDLKNIANMKLWLQSKINDLKSQIAEIELEIDNLHEFEIFTDKILGSDSFKSASTVENNDPILPKSSNVATIEERKLINSDNLLLGVAEISKSKIIIKTDSDLRLNVNTAPFKSFFLTKILGGSGGGGRPDFARAGGGNDKSKIPKACEAIKELIKSL